MCDALFVGRALAGGNRDRGGYHFSSSIPGYRWVTRLGEERQRRSLRGEENAATMSAGDSKRLAGTRENAITRETIDENCCYALLEC